MKLLLYLKTTLKGFISTGLMTIALLIAFPVAMASVMGLMKNGQGEDTLKLKQLKVSIIDEDNSQMSNALVEFLKSDDMKELIKVVDKGDADIKIPKGYEESIKEKKENKITLEERAKGHSVLETLRVILDKYHKNIYLSQSGEKIQELSKILNENSIETQIIDSKKEASSYELMASSVSGFVIMMIIVNLISASYTDISGNLDKRILVAPIKRQEFFIYESIGIFIYSFIVLLCYILFFKVTGLAFKGSILSIFEIVITASLFVTTISKFVSNLFGKKYGQIISMLIFMLPLLSMEMFAGKGNSLAKFTPTHYITKAFDTLNLNGNLSGVEKDLLYLFGISAILFLIVFIKESFSKGGKRCV